MSDTSDIMNALSSFQDRILTELAYEDITLWTSRRGVPHLYASRDNLKISITYFYSTSTFKIWTGCGTPENKAVESYLSSDRAFEIFKGLVAEEVAA